jgi:hypothetical protein
MFTWSREGRTWPRSSAVIELAEVTDVEVPSLRAVRASCGLLAETLGIA